MLIPLFSDPVDLPESEKLTLSLCCCKDRPSVWKAIYFECLTSGKHFLEQVLVSWAFNVWLLGCSLIVFNHVGRKLSNAIVHVCSWQVTALDLIKHEELDQLRDLLKLEFRPLSRLLLLLGWNHCRSLSSAKMLLSILHLDQVRRPPPQLPWLLLQLTSSFTFPGTSERLCPSGVCRYPLLSVGTPGMV